ncbi:FliG C-terminal domain-containing protein [Thiomicrorhabdus sp.]|uniref:FliG C-terminal domain-containing protein n=1 Tax=Thiomicrorhabdus sp. TaxID=2039724 RepID=UPI0029C95006|nr:FliG C-terminal domain-containing protein [Thiomicrorhabdus sp.]
MKVGIQKLHENEWLVHVGFASVKMDRFSVELLAIALESLGILDHGEEHSELNGYLKLGLRIKDLKDLDLQKLLSELELSDLVLFLLAAEDDELKQKVEHNMGTMLCKQLNEDLKVTACPDEEALKPAIRRIVEKSFELETKGVIEFASATARYI